ncbi:hypothetical protein [Croceiramulus getboli]|nr:hypothetical protein P8624_06915 [Flavobacteriaceae bacterium YJPT1-3]
MKTTIKSIIEWVCRLYVFFFLNFYGLGKIAGMQFYRRGKLPAEVAQLTLETADAYSLAWTFMGYSFSYILFVGSLQVLGAWLLLWNRTKFFGVFILIPILVNIIVFDLIFLDQKGAVVNASLYLLMLITIVYCNQEVFVSCLNLLTRKRNLKPFTPKRLLALAFAIILVFLLDQSLVTLVGH